MPLNSGKLEFVKAALPLLLQAKSGSAVFLSAIQQGKPGDAAQTTKVSGLLDQVKTLLAQKWSAQPLTAAQIPEATKQSQQLGEILSGILKNEGDALKGMLQMPLAR